MNRRVDPTGIGTNAPVMRGVTQYHAGNSIPLPSGSIARPEPVFERGYLSQALLDVCALIFLFLFIVIGSLSLPLAIGLLLFARF
jgi:hypothetical protein